MTEPSTPFTRLFNSFLTLLTSSIVGRGLAMLARVLIIRSLPPGRFGVLVLAFTVSSIVAELAILGLPRGVTKMCSSTEDSDDRLDYISAAYRYTFFAGLASAILVYLFRADIASVLSEPEVGAVLGFFVVFIFVRPITSVTIGALRGYEDSTGAALARDVGPKLGGLFALILFSVVGEPYLGAIAYWIVIPIFSLLLGVWFLWDIQTIKRIIVRTPSKVRSRELVGYSWPLALESGLSILMVNIDILILGYFLQREAVGLYKATHPIWKVTLLFLFSFGFLYFPLASRYHTNDDHESLRSFYAVTTKWIVTVTYPLTVFVTLNSGPILQVLYSPEYATAQTALSILAGGMFFRVFVGPNAATIQSIELTKIDLVASSAGLLTNICLNIVLIPEFGIVGAAVATTTGYAVYNGIELVILQRFAGIHPFTWNLVKPLIPTAVLATGLSLAMTPDGLLELASIGILIAGIHLVSLVATRSIQTEDIIVLEQIEDRLGIDLDRLKQYV